MAGKTSGKTSGKKAPAKKAAEVKEKRTDGLFLNRVNAEKYIKAEKSKDGKEYNRVYFNNADGKRCSFLAAPGQIFDIKNSKTGKTVEGYKNVLVGYPDSEAIEVSCHVKDKDGNYPPRFEMKPAEIQAAWNKAGEAMRAKKKENARETPEVAEAAAEAEVEASK